MRAHTESHSRTCRVGHCAHLLVMLFSEVPGTMPTRSAFRVGKTCPRLRPGIAIDAAYACSCTRAILPTTALSLGAGLRSRRIARQAEVGLSLPMQMMGQLEANREKQVTHSRGDGLPRCPLRKAGDLPTPEFRDA